MRAIHIFLVEDHAPDVLLLKEALREQGIAYTLEHYSNGEDAEKAALAPKVRPDLVLLDLNVPRVSGFELLRQLKAAPHFEGVPIAILTSSQSAADMLRTDELGADAYIVKVPSFDGFVNDVGRAIRRLIEGRADLGLMLGSATAHASTRGCSRHARALGLARRRSGTEVRNHHLRGRTAAHRP